MSERQPPPGPDADELLSRLERASGAAERLLSEAARAARERAVPPAGWQVPGGETAQRELDVLAQALGSLRELVPPELQRRLAEALRELLLALRAVIDWYLERSERQRRQPPEVQDIPIQ